jgi:phosphotriesterase-related protein
MEALRGRVQTVRRSIRPEELGPTLMHEHLLCDVTPPALAAAKAPEVEITLSNVFDIGYRWGSQDPGVCRILDSDVAVREMARMRRDGGSAVVELSNHGLKRDPAGLAEIARRADVHVVMGCGHYVHDFLDRERREAGVEAIAREIVTDIAEGVGDTSIRAGIIGEIGCSAPWTEAEQRSMQAAILAQKETGASITVHPGRDPNSPFEIVRFMAAAGADLSRTVMGHLDRAIADVETLLRFADSGCVVQYDMFGIETTLYPYGETFMPNDGMRLDLIRAMIEAGHRDRVVISHDICTRVRQTEFGGHGYGHIFRNVAPLMRRKGFSDTDIEAILVKNPARLLTFA